MRWVLNPSQCIRPAYRACSILMQRSATTLSPPFSAMCIPSGLITPNWLSRGDDGIAAGLSPDHGYGNVGEPWQETDRDAA